MGRMRSAYRITEKCRRSATMPMWRWHFYNRSSAVVAHASVSRGRRANPVLTYETALRRFFCDTSRRVGQSDDVGNRRWRGSGVPPARRGWCRGESRHATLRFAYRVTEECRRSATRVCKPGDVVYIYNRSSAVDANGLMSRGRRANPVLTY